MKRHAPATLRNSAYIADVLAEELPASGTILEIASGSGEHAVYFAQKFPALTWQPSDYDPEALASVAAWTAEANLVNIAPPIHLDVMAHWPEAECHAVLCCNMIHISPWAATIGLFRGCAEVLPEGAPLVLYGPFVEDEVETAPSNESFDRSLKDRNADWGLRNLADVDAAATEHGFVRTARHEMPANNLVLAYRKNPHKAHQKATI